MKLKRHKKKKTNSFQYKVEGVLYPGEEGGAYNWVYYFV